MDECAKLRAEFARFLVEFEEIKKSVGTGGQLTARVTALEKDMKEVQKYINTSGNAIAGILSWIRGFIGGSE